MYHLQQEDLAVLRETYDQRVENFKHPNTMDDVRGILQSIEEDQQFIRAKSVNFVCIICINF